jgi:hypothetical protein
MGSEIERIDVGVQMLEFKQDTGVFQLVSAMKRCTFLEHNIIIRFVEGVHVSADLRTKDGAATTLCWIV